MTLPLVLEGMTLPLVFPSPPEPTDHLLILAIGDDVADGDDVAAGDDVPEPTDHVPMVERMTLPLES
eukprot:1133334-Heterocapsa_arctica.AAC.1